MSRRSRKPPQVYSSLLYGRILAQYAYCLILGDICPMLNVEWSSEPRFADRGIWTPTCVVLPLPHLCPNGSTCYTYPARKQWHVYLTAHCAAVLKMRRLWRLRRNDSITIQEADPWQSWFSSELTFRCLSAAVQPDGTQSYREIAWTTTTHTLVLAIHTAHREFFNSKSLAEQH